MVLEIGLQAFSNLRQDLTAIYKAKQQNFPRLGYRRTNLNCRNNWTENTRYSELIDMRCQQLFPKYSIVFCQFEFTGQHLTAQNFTHDLHFVTKELQKKKRGPQRAICRHEHTTCTSPMKSLHLMDDPTDKMTKSHKKLVLHE